MNLAMFKLSDRSVMLKQHAPTVFVLVGLFMIGFTVMSVQSETKLSTQAANEEGSDADAWGIWFEPALVRADATGIGYLRVKLSTLDESMHSVRLSLNYNPSEIEIVEVVNGAVFPEVEKIFSNNQLTLSSTGSFFGNGTWVTLRVALKDGISSSTIESVDDLSQVRYENGVSRSVKHTMITVSK